MNKIHLLGLLAATAGLGYGPASPRYSSPELKRGPISNLPRRDSEIVAAAKAKQERKAAKKAALKAKS